MNGPGFSVGEGASAVTGGASSGPSLDSGFNLKGGVDLREVAHSSVPDARALEGRYEALKGAIGAKPGSRVLFELGEIVKLLKDTPTTGDEADRALKDISTGQRVAAQAISKLSQTAEDAKMLFGIIQVLVDVAQRDFGDYASRSSQWEQERRELDLSHRSRLANLIGAVTALREVDGDAGQSPREIVSLLNRALAALVEDSRALAEKMDSELRGSDAAKPVMPRMPLDR